MDNPSFNHGEPDLEMGILPTEAVVSYTPQQKAKKLEEKLEAVRREKEENKSKQVRLFKKIASGEEDAVISMLDSKKYDSIINLHLHHDEEKITPLLFAATYGRLKVVKKLIKKDADPNIKDGDGDMPIEVALLRHRYDYLEKEGKYPDKECADKVTDYLLRECKLDLDEKAEAHALAKAFKNKIPYAVDMMNEDNIDIIKAIVDGAEQSLKAKLQNNKQLLNETFCMGWAPLHLAVVLGRIEIVRLLVDTLGAEVTIKTQSRKPDQELTCFQLCLMGSARQAEYRVTTVTTLANIAGKEIKTDEMDVPTVERRRAILNYLVKTDKFTVYLDMIAAVIHNDDNRLTELLKDPGCCKDMVKTTIIDGWYLVHFAAALKHVKALKVLVDDYKADVTVQTRSCEYTVLHLAIMKCSNGMKKVRNIPLKLDLEKLHVPDETTNTMSIIDFLSGTDDKEPMVNPNIENIYRDTALDLSIRYGMNQVFSKLADYHRRDCSKEADGSKNLLHKALALGSKGIKMIHQLIDKGACEVDDFGDIMGEFGSGKDNEKNFKDLLNKIAEKSEYLDSLLDSVIKNGKTDLLKKILTELPAPKPDLPHDDEHSSSMDDISDNEETELESSLMYNRSDNEEEEQKSLSEEEEEDDQKDKVNTPKHDLSKSFIMAINKGNKEMVKLFLQYDIMLLQGKNGKKEDPFFVAVKQGNKQILDQLWDNTKQRCFLLQGRQALDWEDWQVNQCHDEEGWFLLHHAASIGDTDIVEFLQKHCDTMNFNLKTVKNVKQGTGTGSSALVIAVKNKQAEMVKLLCEKGMYESSEYNDCLKKAVEHHDSETAIAIIHDGSIYADGKKKKVPTATLR